MLVCFICMGTQGRTLIDINHPLSNYDESKYKLTIKIEYEYIQSNIFILSAAYLIFLDKDCKKKSFYPRAARDYFLFNPAGG